MIAGKGIPFVDLITPHRELQEELLAAVRGVLNSAMFIGGPELENFEREFAEFCDARYCVGVSSGTDALRFALMAAEVGRGDIVITVANTFVATIEAIVQAGATPYFVEIDPVTFNMDAQALRAFLETECDRNSSASAPIHRRSGMRVKAIMPVHLYGQMCDMDVLTSISEEFGLLLFEDACQAHGSEYFSARKNAWLKAGSIGKAAGFSFYPGKNLGACGEAGAVTTNDEHIAQRIRMIRDHGQNKKYHHLVEGYNGRLDSMQAAILRIKLPLLNRWNEARRAAAKNYNGLFCNAEGIEMPSEPQWSRANYHLYVVRSRQRDELQKHLTENNVGTGLHYPVPLHLQKAFVYLGYVEGSLPETERACREVLSLPMHPHLDKKQQEHVADALLQFCQMQIVG